MRQTVIGIFNDRVAAQDAVDKLIERGFDRSDVDFSYDATEERRESDASDGTFGDRVTRFFNNLFDDSDESNRYSTLAQKGFTISVHTESMERANLASQILDTSGAVEVEGGMSNISSGAMTNDTSVMDDTSRTTSDTDRSIPVIEEEMQVGTREVERGSVRVRSRIIERPVEERLRLREEHLSVERTPVNRPATERDLAAFKEGEIEITERAEVPVVNKEARVVEEVKVRKHARDREETVRGTVRKTDVEVDDKVTSNRLDEDNATL